MQLLKTTNIILIIALIDVFVVLLAIDFENKWPFIGVFSKKPKGELPYSSVFERIASLDSLKNVRSGFAIKKMKLQPAFSPSATGTNAIRLNKLPTKPVSANEPQPALCYKMAACCE